MHMSHNSFKVIVMMPVGHDDRKLWARSCRTLALQSVLGAKLCLGMRRASTPGLSRLIRPSS